MNRNQNSHGLARNLIPEQVIQKRKRRRNKNRKKPQIHVMDRIDLRNLLDGDQKRKNTSNKRSHEEDNTPTKRLKNHHVSSNLESSSSFRLPTSPRTSSNVKSPPTSPRASSNFKSPPTSPRASLSKNFDSGSNTRKSNKISLENLSNWSNNNKSPLTASRRHSVSPRPKKNIAAQRLESLRKSLPENIHSATSTISKKEKHFSNSSRLPEINSSNEHLWNSQSLSGRSNRSSANDRLNALRNKLTVQASETQNNIEPSTSTDNMEYQEEMEWEQVPEEHIIKNIVEIRNSVQENPNIFNGLESSFCFHDSLDMVFNASNVREKSKFIIIIDTNIFLSDLQIVKNLLNCNCNDNDLTIVVPWMVFQELDFFKTKGAKLKQNAQIAVRFINGELANKNPKLKGQTALEAAENVITCRGPDDRILDCSLQYKSDNNITIILSNDINLRNKALVNNIEAYCSDEILKIIASKMENVNKISVPVMDKDLEEKFRQFHKILSNFLLKMLEREMYIAYGDLWKRMVQFKTTWTVPTIIKCILKYWKSVFSFVYPKHLRPCLSQLLQSFDDCELSDPDLKNLIDTALAVCLHLQNISEEYFQIILPIIKELKNLL